VEATTTGQFGGRLSAVLYLLCGGLLAVAVPTVPSGPEANRGAQLAVALVALASGLLIWVLPWHRWPRTSTLVLVPPTFVLITLYNLASGNDGFRYAPFFFITFGWIGMVHPRGTSAKTVPLAAAAYLLPLAIAHHWSAIAAWSIVYVLPSCVLLGEATAWVSERLGRTQHSLREQEAGFRKLFLENPQPMWVFDLDDYQFLEVNAAAIAHYGYSRAEFLAMRVTDIRPTEELQTFIDEVALAPELHYSPMAWRHVLKDGRVIEVAVTAHRLEFKGRPAMLSAIQDVTERNGLERELRHRAFHDALTDLANRSLFANRLEHALARQARDGGSVGVIVLDLDGFKTVNDSLGHSVGDELLFAVGQRLGGAVRPGDTVARLGGDEFAILLEDEPTIDELAEHAGRIVSSLALPFELAGKSLVVTASAGVTLNRTGDGPEELIRNADMAMYLAKRDGKACVRRYEPALHHAALDRLELEGDLRRALDRGELVVHYQPTVQVASGAISGFEALVRWQHPRRGMLGPMEFIPLAEETGLITDIGRWVLGQACRQAFEWQQTYAPAITMAVNVSARQLRDPSLVADVRDALRESGLAATSLTLEITESVLMDSSDGAVGRLHELKALGIRIAIDDFGTGYSSLNYLRALPVDIVKIDKVFVDGVDSDKEARGLIEAILSMAATLDLQAVAEGVESLDQAIRLEQLGSPLVQGFYYAQPLSADAAEALMSAGGALGTLPVRPTSARASTPLR
jgi:diguanylate cyclase (GGDEF)-like protein/PAS domain S-box-containing protein